MDDHTAHAVNLGRVRDRGVSAQVSAEIARCGPIGFSKFMELCLYSPDGGFYTGHGHAGRRGDFITSPEVGPLFGAIMGNYLDELWNEFGMPDPFRVAEVGAGRGTLYRSVRRSNPACGHALEYLLVETSPVQRAAHEFSRRDRWLSMASLDQACHLVLANELLDNLGFDIAERLLADDARGEAWSLVGVEMAPFEPGETARSEFCLAVTGESVPRWFVDLGLDVAPKTRVPVLAGARRWVCDSLRRAPVVLAIDYGVRSTLELVDRDRRAESQMGWLRTYLGHNRGSDPTVAPGGSDITTDIAFDQLPEPTKLQSQTEWLSHHGLEDALSRAADIVQSVAPSLGGPSELARLEALSAASEATALTRPSGLGGFWVAEWRR